MSNNDLVKKIIEEVLKQMGETAPAVSCDDDVFVPDVSEGELIDIYDVKEPENEAAFRNLKRSSPSRIGIGNAGSRYLTKSTLRFEADRATAVDAFRDEIEPEFLEELGIFEVKTLCDSKEEFIQNPIPGRTIDEEGVKIIEEKCEKKKQVQIILSDGHSASAIRANAKAILPTLIEGFKLEGISVGIPFFVRYGRVATEDQIAELLDCDVIINLIGERPALASSKSMSAYIAYRPTVGMVESNRNVVSNISRLGTPPVEAGAHIVDLVKIMLEKKISGTELAKQL